MRPIPMLVAALSLSLLSTAVLADDEPAPTIDTVRELYTNGNYKDALATISRLQQIAGKKAEGLDRFAMFMLKGEIQLRLHDGANALNAFAIARKEATTPEQRDEVLALEDLLRRSAAGVYHPKTGEDTEKTYDLIDDAARKQAYVALLADELAPFLKNFDLLKSTATLAQIVDFVKPLQTIHAVEKAATGKTDKADEVALAMRNRMLALVDTELDSSEKQVMAIRIDAVKTINVAVDVTDPRTQKVTKQNIRRYTGPSKEQVGTLKTIAITCEKFHPMITELKPTLNLTPEVLKVRVTRNDKLALMVGNILTFDFTVPVPKNATPPTFLTKQGG